MDTKLLVGLIIRHALTIAGGYATGSGLVSDSELSTGVGAITALVGIALSVMDKLKRK